MHLRLAFTRPHPVHGFMPHVMIRSMVRPMVMMLDRMLFPEFIHRSAQALGFSKAPALLRAAHIRLAFIPNPCRSAFLMPRVGLLVLSLVHHALFVLARSA